MDPMAFLDANILWSGSYQDIIHRAARNECFVPVWSIGVLDELQRGFTEKHPNLGSIITGYINDLNDLFQLALIQGYDDLIPCMNNDEEDRHVLAAAARSEVSLIVTDNLKHFPYQFKKAG